MGVSSALFGNVTPHSATAPNVADVVLDVSIHIDKKADSVTTEVAAAARVDKRAVEVVSDGTLRNHVSSRPILSIRALDSVALVSVTEPMCVCNNRARRVMGVDTVPLTAVGTLAEYMGKGQVSRTVYTWGCRTLALCT